MRELASLFSVMTGECQATSHEVFEVGKIWSGYRGELDWSLRSWQRKSEKLRNQVLAFLNGTPLECHGNRIRYIVPEDCHKFDLLDDASVAKRLLRINPNFGIKLYFASPNTCIKVSIVPDSIRLVRRFAEMEKVPSEYRDIIVDFDTVFQCVPSITDLSDSELAKSCPLMVMNSSEYDLMYLRAVKAILQSPDRVYIGRSSRFIVLRPQNSAMVNQIFLLEMEGSDILQFNTWLRYAVLFAPTSALRNALRLGKSQFKFDDSSFRTCKSEEFFGNLVKEGHCHVVVKLPLLDARPLLFVKNVRLGCAACAEYVKKCQSQGRLEYASMKSGTFELDIKFFHRMVKDVSSWQSKVKQGYSTVKPDMPQWEESELAKKVCGYLSSLTAYLGHMADFVESLAQGSNDIDIVRNNFLELMANQVQLDPTNYLNDENEHVRRLANYYVSGSME